MKKILASVFTILIAVSIVPIFSVTSYADETAVLSPVSYGYSGTVSGSGIFVATAGSSEPESGSPNRAAYVSGVTASSYVRLGSVRVGAIAFEIKDIDNTDQTRLKSAVLKIHVNEVNPNLTESNWIKVAAYETQNPMLSYSMGGMNESAFRAVGGDYSFDAAFWTEEKFTTSGVPAWGTMDVTRAAANAIAAAKSKGESSALMVLRFEVPSDAVNITTSGSNAPYLTLTYGGEDASVNIRCADAAGRTILSLTENDLFAGDEFEADYPSIINYGGDYYVYDGGVTKIESLSSGGNTLELIYRSVTLEDYPVVNVKTKVGVEPDLPRVAAIVFDDGTRVVSDVEWIDFSVDEYASVGEFVAYGIAEGDVFVEAHVTVVENYDMFDGYLSSDSFTTNAFAAKPGAVEIEFDVSPLKNYIDGYIGFTGSKNTVSQWTDCPIVLRMYTDGRFQCRDGDDFVKSNAFYEKGAAYHIKMVVDVDNKTFSAYASRRGTNYGITLCENAAFRTGAQTISDVGRVCVRGGSGATAGEFKFGNLTVRSADEIELVREYRSDESPRCFDFLATEDASAIVYLASYDENGTKSIAAKKISCKKGETVSTAFDAAGDYKLMVWNGETLAPLSEKRNSEDLPELGFTSAFMGSFTYYNNGYESGLNVEDHHIIQTLTVESFSDRYEFSVKNHGVVIPGEEAPEVYTVMKQGGDGRLTDTPITKILCMSDIHIGKERIATLDDAVRPALRRVCAEYADDGYDAVIIGGDFVYNNAVTKERWQYVLDENFKVLSGVTPNIILVSGNHDHYVGESMGYYSGDYYTPYMKDALGVLDESNSYWEDDYPVAFVYEIADAAFIGINTRPSDMAGSLQHSNYIYSEGAMDWLEEKLAYYGEDKTVFLAIHIPPRDSNNITSATKGMLTDVSRRMTDICAKYPNLVMIYGHDHGSLTAYYTDSVSERVTRYDEYGNKVLLP